MVYKFKIIYGGTLESTIFSLEQYIDANVDVANILTDSIINNNYDDLNNNNELKKLVYQALIKSHKNKHDEIKIFILDELKNREISILSLNTLYNSENNLNKIKVLNFVNEFVNIENLLDVLDIVEIVNPDQLDLDNFKNINDHLNIALASGDGTYNRNIDDNNNQLEYPNVMTYFDSARIHIYLPEFVLNDFINFNWIIENNFQNNILIIWLDIFKVIPNSFINLFKNRVDYITSDDIRYNISPYIANSILKQNGYIKVKNNDNRYSKSNFSVAENSEIIEFYQRMFNEGMGGSYKIYKKN